MMKKFVLAAALFSAVSTLPAHAGSVQLGILDCVVDGGTSYVIGSNKGLACTFKPYNKAYGPDVYSGVISKLGADLGMTHQSSISWAVLATDWDGYGTGALAGKYFGASADASLVTGGGVNVLLGGNSRAFTLQPLSVQTQTGVNVALAVTQLELYTSLK
ncbi:DUF992 domain-containing protein [Mesorhizobium sp. DCY119]|nr:DUF992 domain-containing protein [Mesorhizobium sp. DCY119]